MNLNDVNNKNGYGKPIRGEGMISKMEYRKGNYIARMAVLDTDNRRFRGMVLILQTW